MLAGFYFEFNLKLAAVRFKGHFGELSVLQSGAFTVDKCFDVSSVALRETIVSEMLEVQAELSKTKQGPHLLRKFDLDGYFFFPFYIFK
ncbi:putative nucleolar protein [Helianthus annuus]|nr:putative nucleolar protein [Helianthus annuus]